jgi:hypothetical protein
MVRRHLLAVASVVCGLGIMPASAQSSINLTLDRATVIKAPAKTSMLIVGNPAIADVAIQKNGVVVLTGKAHGETNLLALDDQGQLVSETWLKVQASDRNLVVFRGAEPETYNCSPNCRPTIALGDSEKHFARAGGQTTARNGLANTTAPQR